MYIRIAFSIELRLRVSRSLANLPSSNTLISMEQRGGVRNKYMYILIAFSIKLQLRVSRSLRSLAKYSISRTILPGHTDKAPIKESAYHFWSKTGKS